MTASANPESNRKPCFEHPGDTTTQAHGVVVIASARIPQNTLSNEIEKHVVQEDPGKQPAGERKHSGQIKNRDLKKIAADAKTQANTGCLHTGPDFEKHVFQENPGKRPDGEHENWR